jgi:tetratricopeptide (TPR) repeat protein
MIRHIRNLLAAAAIATLAIYIVITNSTPLQFTLFDLTLAVTSGILSLLAFGLGVCASTLVATFFAVRSYLRERSLKKQARDRAAFYESFVTARGHMASGEFERAQDQWLKILKREPQNVIARVELSRTLECAGLIRDALEALELARTQNPHNVEVLLRAADLNVQLNNNTLALDNLALAVYHAPSKIVIKKARDLAEHLERFDDALEYHEKLTMLGISEDEALCGQAQILFKKLLHSAAATSGQDPDHHSLEDQIREFLRRFPTHVPALTKLARLEQEQGNSEAAAHLLVRAAKQSNDPALWEELSTFWVNEREPVKALASAKASLRGLTGLDLLQGELEYAHLLITRGILDEASRVFQSTLATIESLAVIPEHVAKRVVLLRALLATAERADKVGFEPIEQLFHPLPTQGPALVALLRGHKQPTNKKVTAPAPRLSTP